MKTKTLILSLSLDLLNEQGDSNTSSLDIADTVGISPGNLYYHYKGKTEIIDALTINLQKLLKEFHSHLAKNSQEEQWLSLYILLEHLYRYRFIFRNTANLAHNYPNSNKNINQVLYYLFHSLDEIILSLTDGKRESIPTDIILIFFINWVEYRNTINPTESEKECILEAMIRLEMLLIPYISNQISSFMAISNHSYKTSN